MEKFEKGADFISSARSHEKGADCIGSPTGYERFLQNLRGKHVSVVGYGITHRPLCVMLRDAGVHVSVYDERPIHTADRIEGVDFFTAPLGDLGGDLIFRTPGLRPDHPSLLRARERGIWVTSEMELFLRFCPFPVIGITGSDGKTTTTSLIAAMLHRAGHKVWLGGNIGNPLLPAIPEMERCADIAAQISCKGCESIAPLAGDAPAGGRGLDEANESLHPPTPVLTASSGAAAQAHAFAVVELSSFQLMTIQQSPHIAVVTNISANHLNWHPGMDEYVAAKQNIYLHQKKENILVVNAHNLFTKAFVAPGEKRFFGVETPWETPLRGQHNQENIAAAWQAVRGIVSEDCARAAVREFNGVPHRDEYLGCFGGIHYYNDSIASTPTRTLATLSAHPEQVHLIGGGRDKNTDFREWGKFVERNCKSVTLYGEAAKKMGMATHISTLVKTLPEAVRWVQSRAKPGDTVVLSPACTSFDQYNNFEQRGEHFRQLTCA